VWAESEVSGGVLPLVPLFLLFLGPGTPVARSWRLGKNLETRELLTFLLLTFLHGILPRQI